MKVFLSWSGDLSHKVACRLRDWLPSVIQSLKPYVSSEDIDKGARWSTDIAKELAESSYGIICVTPHNLDAPWVHFEAGALSKSLEKANVVPFLFKVKRSEVQGPLLQFQSVIYEKPDLEKLLRGLNAHLEAEDQLSEEQLAKAFEVWWPQLRSVLDELAAAPARPSGQKEPEGPTESEILEELLELSRTQQRLLNSPELLLPASYLQMALRELDFASVEQTRQLSFELDRAHSEVISAERALAAACEDFPELADLKERIEYLHHRLHRVLPRRRQVRRPRVVPRREADDSK